MFKGGKKDCGTNNNSNNNNGLMILCTDMYIELILLDLSTLLLVVLQSLMIYARSVYVLLQRESDPFVTVKISNDKDINKTW